MSLSLSAPLTVSISLHIIYIYILVLTREYPLSEGSDQSEVVQGHVEAETVFLNSFFERQSGPRARLRRHSRAPKWLPSTPAQRFLEFLRVFSSQVAPAPRLREPPTRQTRCRNERGFLYRYMHTPGGKERKKERELF